MTQDTQRLGDRIREARTMRGWTQAELAARVGIDHTGISHLESGRRENVQIDTLMRLADALEVTPQWLLKPWT